MSKTTTALLVTICLTLGALRLTMHRHPPSLEGSYQALAHLVTGSLAGAWLVNRNRLLLTLFLALCALEVFAAFLLPFLMP